MKRILLSTLLALGCATAQAQGAPYAGQEARGIKSLSDQEVADLVAGQGMGLAKPAELNGYPGPAHVLEHADALQLNPSQRQSTQALMLAHKQRARELGRDVLAAEQALDRAFASRAVDAAGLARLTAEAGQRHAALREEHLRTHLEQTALLEARQVQRYNELRGYTGGAQPSPAHPHRHHGGHRP